MIVQSFPKHRKAFSFSRRTLNCTEISVLRWLRFTPSNRPKEKNPSIAWQVYNCSCLITSFPLYCVQGDTLVIKYHEWPAYRGIQFEEFNTFDKRSILIVTYIVSPPPPANLFVQASVPACVILNYQYTYIAILLLGSCCYMIKRLYERGNKELN